MGEGDSPVEFVAMTRAVHRIETHVEVKSAVGFPARMFVIGFTNRRPDQLRATRASAGRVSSARTVSDELNSRLEPVHGESRTLPPA